MKCGPDREELAQTTLPAGCSQTAYRAATTVWVLCNATSAVKVLRIDPATRPGRCADRRALPGPAFTFVAGSEGVWLGTNAGLLQVDPSGTHLTRAEGNRAARDISTSTVPTTSARSAQLS